MAGSIIVTCLRLYHMTSILHSHWREFWSCDTDVFLTYIRFGIILTQLYINFSRQEHHRCLIGVVKLLRFSGYSLYPFHFSFTVPLNYMMEFIVRNIQGQRFCGKDSIPIGTKKDLFYSLSTQVENYNPPWMIIIGTPNPQVDLVCLFLYPENSVG